MTGRKNAIPAYQLLNDQSLAATFQSSPVTLATATHIGFNIATASVTDNTGVFSVQHRVYKDVNFFSAWATLTLSGTPALNDTNANLLIDVTVPPGQVRLVFTAAGGVPNGNCDVWVSGDQV